MAELPRSATLPEVAGVERLAAFLLLFLLSAAYTERVKEALSLSLTPALPKKQSRAHWASRTAS